MDYLALLNRLIANLDPIPFQYIYVNEDIYPELEKYGLPIHPYFDPSLKKTDIFVYLDPGATDQKRVDMNLAQVQDSDFPQELYDEVNNILKDTNYSTEQIQELVEAFTTLNILHAHRPSIALIKREQDNLGTNVFKRGAMSALLMAFPIVKQILQS